jgi:hypothetical protein
MPRTVLLAALFAAAACVAGACTVVPPDLAEGRYTAALVDSFTWKAEHAQATLWRVEVRSDSAVDTIPDVLTDRRVVVVPLAGVEGFAFDTARAGITHGFRYDPTKRRVTKIVIAEDLADPMAEPELSPDGRHVVYVAYDETRTRAAVRLFPRGRIVVQGPEIAVPAGDYAVNAAAWTSPDSFAVYIDLGTQPARHARVRGTVRGGVFAVDTVTAQDSSGALGQDSDSGT